MADGAIEQVRSFNRTVTEMIGALDERYMGRHRPLGEARVLWEIGGDECELAALRARLGLDSGYLSRLLRALEASGLIRVQQNPGDRRARVVKLTSLGRRERATLDQRSDVLARSLLEPLTAPQRERLVEAMCEVEQLLTAASVKITAVDPEHRDARSCLEQYTVELNRRSTRQFDPTVGATALPDELRPAQIKRMWLAPSARGLGIGRRLLRTLEDCAREAGAGIARIETNSDLTEAMSLYASAGWVEVARFNDEPYADRWLEKTLND